MLVQYVPAKCTLGTWILVKANLENTRSSFPRKHWCCVLEGVDDGCKANSKNMFKRLCVPLSLDDTHRLLHNRIQVGRPVHLVGSPDQMKKTIDHVGLIDPTDDAFFLPQATQFVCVFFFLQCSLSLVS